MRKSNRDDFPPRTKQGLWMRVSGRCSNPDCRVQTQGPASDHDGTVNVGKAAHITAAAPGGPRYGPTLTPEQRKGFENGIWLCAIHADLVDKDVSGHSVGLLSAWKQNAEQAAKSELGKKLPSNDDAVKLLTTALSGNSHHLASSAINNVHQAVSQSLQSFDPRLQVSSSYRDGVTVFDVVAKEPVPLQLTFDIAKHPEVKEGLHDLFAKGKDFEVAASAVRLEGSPLFDTIARECANGKFGMQVPHKPAKMKSFVQSKESGERTYFDDIDAEVSGGSSFVEIRGLGWGGHVSITINVPTSDSTEEANVEIDINLEAWEGIEIGKLPYFYSLSDFFERLAAGDALFITLTAQGKQILESKAIVIGEVDVVRHSAGVFTYIKNVLTIANLTKTKIAFRGNHAISMADFQACSDAANVATGNFRILKEELRRNPQLTVTVGSGMEEALEQADVDLVVQIRDQETLPILAFGQSISLPLCTTTLAPARIKRLDDHPLIAGQRTIVEVQMLDGFAVTRVFQPLG